MKKRLSTKLCALFLCVSMVLSMAACAKKNNDTSGGNVTKAPTNEAATTTPEGGSKVSKEDLVTITLYPAAGNIPSGIVGGYKGDYFASLGFQVEVWAYSDEKTNAILASGDLPDVMYVSDANHQTMIEAGMLLNLDDYLDQMPHAQAYKPLATALNYIRENKSAGTGGVYFLPGGVGDSSNKYAFADSTDRHALKLKWDVYEQIGAPKINDIWDVIDVMEQMVQASPKDADGNPYYGTILNNGSDTEYWANMTLFYRWQGYLERDLPYLLETNMVTGELKSILDDDSLYHEGLKWYNEVYRRGLMDPDSINNDRPTQKAKVDAGYAMIPSGYLPGWAPNYYEYYIPGTDIYYKYSSTYGGAPYIGINAKTQHQKEALAFVDMLCDPDANLVITNGPDGEFWKSDGSGNAFLTDKALEYLKNSGSYDGFVLSTGEKLELWNTPWVISTGADTSYKDGNGNARIPYTQQWAEVNEIRSNTDSYKRWQQTTGQNTWKEWLGSHYYATSPLDDVQPFYTIADDKLKLSLAAIRDTVVDASWRMVYAESEADFNKTWDKMVKDCEGLDAAGLQAWKLADIEKAKVTRDSLAK